ncbi:MAG: 4Fe-4S binding protein [Spirochaetales bacterium]|nr:4Fe-4S binding protein [Spirochaetales bacterium]
MNERNQIVYTLTARCRDCYRCLKACPVKAIKMKDGQASVDPNRCIACGTCIKECPQGAKVYRRDIEKVKKIIKEAPRCAISLAPSFSAIYSKGESKRLTGALRRLGFSYIGETAISAYDTALATVKEASAKGTQICSACPAVVNYVEKYDQKAVSKLINVHSPMITHGRRIKELLGDDTAVIFIGPCIAKKSEIEKDNSFVEAALTFEELEEWLEDEQIDLLGCEESNFNEIPLGNAPLFPLPGGLLKTAGLDEAQSFHTSGFNELKEGLEYIQNQENEIIEPLFCREGCVNGPGINTKKNLYQRKQNVIRYNRELNGKEKNIEIPLIKFHRHFDHPEETNTPTEKMINQILAKTGKESPDKQLNCGSCGYKTCREKAIAVLEGMAEIEMCLPYMRRLAEQRTDKIIETSPNGIVILDFKLEIIKMNPAFKKLFQCTDNFLGKKVSRILDPAPFEKLATGQDEKIEQTQGYAQLNISCHEIYYPLKGDKQYVGIFVDITNLKSKDKKLKTIQEQTIFQARELLEHQIEMAQQIAGFLGKNTARSEELVNKLMYLTEEKNEY